MLGVNDGTNVGCTVGNDDGKFTGFLLGFVVWFNVGELVRILDTVGADVVGLMVGAKQ